MSANTKNIRQPITGSDLHEYVKKIVEERDELIKAQKLINDRLDEIDLIVQSIRNFIGEKQKNTTKSKEVKNSDNSLPEKLSGSNLFLWGLERLGNIATAREVAMEVKKLNVDVVQDRVMDNSLNQWLMVGANSLCKNKILKKEQSSDRKGGVVFKRV